MTARIYVQRSLADFPTPTPQPTPCRLWQGPLQEGYGQRFSRTGHRRMHRWVMSVALGRPLARNEVVMHLCDQPLCYRFDHLRLGTVAENNADMRSKGRARFAVQLGEQHHRAALTDDLVREIRASSESTRKIAARLGLHHATVHDARIGRTWKHVQ